MKENTQEKSLIQVNEKNMFYKIKIFLKKLFYKNKDANEINLSAKFTNKITEKETSHNSFIQEIKNIETEETILLKLQKKYRSGEIKGEELSKKQILELGKLYDKQIADLRKYNKIEKQKLLEYRKKLQIEN